MTIDVHIEAFLFYKAVPQRKQVVARAVGIPVEELPQHLEKIRGRLEQGALTLVETEQEIQMTTRAALSDFISALRKDELRADIGRAGAETLAIILCREPITRSEIDMIRGVNSSVTIRNLLTRGLISRTTKNGAYYFSITPELLQHLGIRTKQELPHYSSIMDRLDNFAAEMSESEP